MLTALAVAGYALTMVLLGWVAGRKIETEADFLVAGRRLPLWLAWGTLLATWFGAGTIIGASEAARDEGLRGVLLDPFASGLALILAGLVFARRMWDMQLLTMGDFFKEKYGPRTERVSSVVQAVGYYPWIAAQYIALGAILHDAFGWTMNASIVVAALFVLYLTISGGLWSVTITDSVQAVVMLVALVLLGYVFFSELGASAPVDGVKDTLRRTPSHFLTLLPAPYWLAWAAWSATWTNGVLGNISGQDLMQRVFACKNARTAQLACVLAGAIYLLFGLLPVLLGLASRLVLPDADSTDILVTMSNLYLSPTMQVVFVVALLSIVVSTATSALLSPSALLAHNVLEHFSIFRARPVATERGAVVLSMLLSLPLAFASDDILGLLEEALAIGLVALIVPFLGGFFGHPRGERPGILSVSLGGIAWLAYKATAWLLLPDDISFGTASDWQAVWMAPAEFVGVGASLVGYLLGQHLERSQHARTHVQSAADR